MSDASLVAKRLAIIETCVAQLRALARPEVLRTDVARGAPFAVHDPP